MEKRPYRPPTIRRVKNSDLVLRLIRQKATRYSCRQCSGCHGCR